MHYLILCFCFFVCACGQQYDNAIENENKNGDVVKNAIDSIPTNYKSKVNDVEQIIFGFFFGECSKNCATMYRYNNGGNANSLWVDYTDSYFKKGVNKITFETQITDLRKYDLANDILGHIPNFVFLSKKPSQTFGCPDCSDGGGIYFEVKQNGKFKKFYFDYSTSEMSDEIKVFADYLKIVIRKFNDSKN